MNQFQKELSVQSLPGEIHYRQFKFGIGKQMKPNVLFVNFQQIIGWLLREDRGYEKNKQSGRSTPVAQHPHVASGKWRVCQRC
jgi:hypothetical protein